MPFVLQAMSNANQASRTETDSAPPVIIPIDGALTTVDLSSPSSSHHQPGLNATTPGSGFRVIFSSLKASAGPNFAPPPSYEEALHPHTLPPPAYESLFGHVQTAHRSSDGITEFVKNLTILLFGTVGCLACIGLAVVIPLAMIVVGTRYYSECPVEPHIPLYLVVGGGLTLANNLLGNFRVQADDNEVTLERRKSPIKAFVTTFMFVWFVLGSFWVYREYEPSYNPLDANYCHPTVYLLAFWIITSSYIVLFLLMTGVCCISCMAVGAVSEQIQAQSPLR